MPGMPGYGNNPMADFELGKARSNAQNALIFSIIGFLCCFPLSIVGLVKSQEALKVFDKYHIEDDRGKAVAAKVIAIAGLVLYALFFLMRFIPH